MIPLAKQNSFSVLSHQLRKIVFAKITQIVIRGVMKMSKCCCSSDDCCQPQPKKPINIDFLYLDTTVCGRCKDTEKTLDEAVSSVAVVLNAAGYEVKVNKVNIASKELAIEYQFISSPTIRVNGNDIAVELKESLCEDCGTLCGNNVDCRVWVYNGVEYTSPPKELIVDAILREVYNTGKHEPDRRAYQLPENLEKYFIAKAHKDGVECWEKGGNSI
jgi:glutaredoxin